MKDIDWMRMALKLAKKGEGNVNPNPMVGAVVVKDHQLLAKGYHRAYGMAHAEREALCNAKEDVAGATLYVTLEPCCHEGKTPPCTNLIIEKKIRRVVIGTQDINPFVAGKGIAQLKAAGIEVVVGVLEQECRWLNEVFFHYMKTKRPFVTLKYAMTLDGKIATKTGDSKWITGEMARKEVHKLRKKNMAIMVGIQTVKMDDPLLNVRAVQGKNPMRIICDSKLQIPMDSKIVRSANEIKTILVIAKENHKNDVVIKQREEKIKALEQKGCRVVEIASSKDGIDLNELMSYLGKEQIDSLLIEGGATLAASAMEEHLVDMLNVYIAPKLCMGQNAPSPMGKDGILYMKDAQNLKEWKIKKIGEDICIKGRVKESCLRD